MGQNNSRNEPISEFFNNAHHFVINQATLMGGNHQNDKESIDLLSQNTIPGAQFDSGERYPPPFCHPGTRLDISGKLVFWVRDLKRKQQVVWLHGPAGVGKSAVIQTLAEAEAHSPTSSLGATLFFSRPNERDDPQRVILTVAYQLAVKYPAYRTYIVELLSLDPLLVKKSLVEQFKWLIIRPFAEKKVLEGSHETILITLDGLDECNGELAQREIVTLITKFSLQYPTTPLIWIIASRPEPQICTAFSHPDVRGSYVEIDMPVDSDQACADVERYLRDKFTEIKENYSTAFTSPDQQWPTETEFAKVATRSSGLFVFANTVVRFTEDAEYGNPVAQLQKVVDVIDSTLSSAARDAPFAALDILYTLILSRIPPRILPITRKLLMFPDPERGILSLTLACNVIFISQAEAYSALRKLHSVIDIPPPRRAHRRNIRAYHTSFVDYLQTPSRSESFWLDPEEVRSVLFSAYTRILLEAHRAAVSNVRTSNISIAWPNGAKSSAVLDEQKTFFRWSLYSMLRAPPEQWEHFDKLRGFFQDIDYTSVSSLLPTPEDGIEVAAVLLKSHFLPRLRDWGVVATLPMQFLDLGAIGADELTYIFSDRPSVWDLELGPEEDRAEWDESTFTSAFIKDFFDSSSRAAEVHAWHQKTVNLSDQPGWTAHVHRHLTTVMGLLPSHPVTVFGRGRKSCVLIAVDAFGQLWVYMLPYKQS